MLKLGTKCIKNLKLGDKTIFKGIKGGKTVYRNYPIFLDYIESDRNQWIDTNFKPNQDTTVNITWSESSEANYGTTFFGTRDTSSPTNAFVFWGAGAGYWRDQYGNQNFTSTIPRDTKKHTLIKDKNKTYLDGELFKEHTYTEFNCSHNMYLFCLNEGGVANFWGRVKIYNCLIYDNGVLIQDLRPAIDPCGVVCMYDMVTNKYFYNQGTGEFKAGGRFVESIESDGNSYVNTGKTLTNNSVLEIVAQSTNKAQFNNTLIGVGTNAGSADRVQIHFGDSGGLLSIRIDGTVYTGYQVNTNKFTSKLDIQSKKGYINDQECISDFTGQIDTVNEIKLFCRNSSDDGASYFSQAKIYAYKLYEGQVLIQDLRPYVDVDGVACFKDVVTDTLFYNQGTGTLTYTEFERIPYLEFDRTTYIDTEYIPNKNTEFTYKVKLYAKQGDINPMFGARIAYSVDCYNLLQIGNGPRLDWNGTGNIVFLNTMVGNTSTLKIGNGRVLLNGSSVATYTQKETELSHSFLIGNMNENGVVYSKNGSKQDVCFCSLSENGVIKRELYPVKRSDGVKCLYDRVENKYYELKVA